MPKPSSASLRMWKTLLTAGPVFSILISVQSAVAETQQGTIPNPITSTSFPCLVKAITEAAIQITVPLAVVAIIIAGVRFLFAGVRGSDAEITKAKTMLFWVVIGVAVVVGSFVIANAAVQFLGGAPAGEIAC
jgi:hypothetical protein